VNEVRCLHYLRVISRSLPQVSAIVSAVSSPSYPCSIIDLRFRSVRGAMAVSPDLIEYNHRTYRTPLIQTARRLQCIPSNRQRCSVTQLRSDPSCMFRAPSLIPVKPQPCGCTSWLERMSNAQNAETRSVHRSIAASMRHVECQMHFRFYSGDFSTTLHEYVSMSHISSPGRVSKSLQSSE
jgi:hypothetical protein